MIPESVLLISKIKSIAYLDIVYYCCEHSRGQRMHSGWYRKGVGSMEKDLC